MLEILYEDEQVIVVWKPVGVESQESRGFGADMVSEIRKHIHSSSTKRPGGMGIPYVGVIHRLDKPVSGILVYAKTKNAAAALSRQVADGKMEKKYLAVLCGKPAQNVDNFVDYLLKDGKENRSAIVDKGITGAKRAELVCRVLGSTGTEAYGELTLAEISLKTGRHHQIRVQMAGHGTPLWGDGKYNPRFAAAGREPAFDSAPASGSAPAVGAGPRAARRVDVALAAYSLSFRHPATGKKMTFRRLPEGGGFDLTGALLSQVVL